MGGLARGAMRLQIIRTLRRVRMRDDRHPYRSYRLAVRLAKWGLVPSQVDVTRSCSRPQSTLGSPWACTSWSPRLAELACGRLVETGHADAAFTAARAVLAHRTTDLAYDDPAD
jgi:hypothetical protein